MTQNEVEFNPASKSQLKRDSLAIQGLGKKLAALPAEQLAQIPLDDEVREAIELARRIQTKRSALKRQYQYIGKLLRVRELESIVAALEAIARQSRHAIQHHHLAERWRRRILDQGDDAIEAFVALATAAERQKLRQIARNHRQAKSDAKRAQHNRQLYHEIKRSLERENNGETSL